MIEIIKKLEARIIKLENHIKFKAQGVHEHDEYLKKDLTYTKKEIDEKIKKFIKEVEIIKENLNNETTSIYKCISIFSEELLILKKAIEHNSESLGEIKKDFKNININVNSEKNNEELFNEISNSINYMETLKNNFTLSLKELNSKIELLKEYDFEYVEKHFSKLIKDNNEVIKRTYITQTDLENFVGALCLKS